MSNSNTTVYTHEYWPAESPPLPLEYFYRYEAEIADNDFLVQPNNGEATHYSWREVGDQSRRVASYLRSLNMPAGSKVALLAKNSAHWVMADLAIWMAGHVTVPLYPAMPIDHVEHVIDHSDAEFIFLSGMDNWEEMQAGLRKVERGIALPGGPDDPRFISWQAVIEQSTPLTENTQRAADELATIVYTSGSTGMPKGAMLNFSALAAATVLDPVYLHISKDDRGISYLPLAHVAERLTVEMGSISCGTCIYFSEGLETFTQDLRRARPTIFFSVPRLWMKFKFGILQNIPAEQLDKLLDDPATREQTQKAVLEPLGLDQVRYAFCGSAPMSQDLLSWYQRLGMNILEGYGMTENFGYSFATIAGQERLGYVGTVRPGVEAKLTEQGEVLVRAHTNMTGYYKAPEKTREALTDDGFVCTGDKGEFDEQGRLRITGRIKELFKTSKGKYVAPAPIEDKILSSLLLEACCVMGSGEPQPIALLMLSPDARVAAANADQRAGMTQQFAALLADVNAQIEAHEKLHALIIVKDEWNIENGYLTPTMKIKRSVVESAYEPRLGEWYAADKGIYWEA